MILVGLDPRQTYDVLSALRGPDQQGRMTGDAVLMQQERDVLLMRQGLLDRIKGMITGRLRAIVFPEYEDRKDGTGVPYDTFPGCYTAKPMVQEELDRLRAIMNDHRDLRGRNWHFFSHLHSAVQATVDHPVWGGFGREVKRLIL